MNPLAITHTDLVRFFRGMVDTLTADEAAAEIVRRSKTAIINRVYMRDEYVPHMGGHRHFFAVDDADGVVHRFFSFSDAADFIHDWPGGKRAP